MLASQSAQSMRAERACRACVLRMRSMHCLRVSACVVCCPGVLPWCALPRPLRKSFPLRSLAHIPHAQTGSVKSGSDMPHKTSGNTDCLEWHECPPDYSPQLRFLALLGMMGCKSEDGP